MRDRRLLGAGAVLGLAGAVLVALAAPRAVSDPVVGWWYHPSFPGSRAAGVTLIWVGMGALAAGWLAIASRGAPSRGFSLLVASAWLVPLVLAPPLFSRDVYSYLAQGTILHLGHDPYQQSPAILAGLHRGHVLAAVSPFWRHTTAPYGPLFLELINLVVAICGQHLIAGVLACRALDLVGLVLVAIHLPRVAQALGGSSERGLWLVLAAPLVALGLVAPAHNDLLMDGLLVWALSVALRGNPLGAVFLCAVAATIKVPALAAAVFIAVAWARTESGPGRWRLLGGAAAIVVAVLGVVTLASGVGLGWLGASVFSTPAKVRLAITPATGVGYTIAWLLRAIGVSVSAHGLETACGAVTTGLVALVGLWLLWRVRVGSLVVALSATLLLAAGGGPAAWPWYFTWGLVGLAAVRGADRSPWLLGALVVGGFLVKPNGVLALPLGSAPAVVLVQLALAGAAVSAWRRRRDAGAGGDGGSAPPAAGAALPPPDRGELVRT